MIDGNKYFPIRSRDVILFQRKLIRVREVESEGRDVFNMNYSQFASVMYHSFRRLVRSHWNDDKRFSKGSKDHLIRLFSLANTCLSGLILYNWTCIKWHRCGTVISDHRKLRNLNTGKITSVKRLPLLNGRGHRSYS